MRPGAGEPNNVQLLLSKTCAQCKQLFTTKVQKLVCGVCNQNVCLACAPSCGSDHTHGLQLSTDGAVCTQCVDSAMVVLIEKCPSWVTPSGYVAVALDFMEVTYCDASWWEERGNLGSFPQSV